MRKIILPIATVMVLASGACGGAEQAPQKSAPAPETATELKIVAADFGFDLGGVESVAPGEVQITLENRGEQSHEAQLYLLDEGVTYEQFIEAAAAGETTDLPPEAADLVTPGRGVTSNIDPGDSITVPAPVEAGTYAFVCHLLDPESLSPHFTLGMMAPLEVR